MCENMKNKTMNYNTHTQTLLLEKQVHILITEHLTFN